MAATGTILQFKFKVYSLNPDLLGETVSSLREFWKKVAYSVRVRKKEIDLDFDCRFEFNADIFSVYLEYNKYVELIQ